MINKMDKKYLRDNSGQLVIYREGNTGFISVNEILFMSDSLNINKNKGNVLTKGFPNQLKDGDTVNGVLACNVLLDLNKPYFYYKSGMLETYIIYLYSDIYSDKKDVYVAVDDFDDFMSYTEFFDREGLENFFRSSIVNETGRYIIERHKGLTFARNNIDGIYDDFSILSDEEIVDIYNSTFNFNYFNNPDFEDRPFKLDEIKDFVINGSLVGTPIDCLIVTTNDIIYKYMFRIIMKESGVFMLHFKGSKFELERLLIDKDISVNLDISLESTSNGKKLYKSKY